MGSETKPCVLIHGLFDSYSQLFVRDDRTTLSVGISGDYLGAIVPRQWTRLAVTVADNGDGTSRLAKFIDGKLVGEQSVETDRFAIRPSSGLFLLTGT